MADLPTVSEHVAYRAHLEQLARDCADLHDWAWIDVLMREAASVLHPYPICAWVTGTTSALILTDDAAAGEVDYLWYLLGDWYEFGSDDDAVEAESWMRAAAQEWVALAEDPHSRTEYLRRWTQKIKASGVSRAPPNPEMDRLFQRARDDDLAWPRIKARFPLGAQVRGLVFARQPGGVFARLDDAGIGVSAIGVIEASDLPSKPGADRVVYPHRGAEVSGTVVEHRDSDHQLRLGVADL